jgi:hypothetical protein
MNETDARSIRCVSIAVGQFSTKSEPTFTILSQSLATCSLAAYDPAQKSDQSAISAFRFSKKSVLR